ncbi:MAG TPA: tRNA dihydrouridine(20/20a) synthase DusA [Xanthomonadales bacterium]|nr:tRNA dihydrouridine(20/20a) synthase DusA [Xanthomonadales bacterium]
MKKIEKQNRLVSVAPMMDWTDRHCRYFHRLLSPQALLYTEMVTSGAILHGDRDHLLAFNPEEHPLALQLGGSDPEELARCARIAQVRGYDEVNLNVGCPSDRVQRGRFGACLMLEPKLVRDCIAAMLDVTNLPVTVKCRLGVDEQESYAYFSDFLHTVAGSGCTVFIVHARKAWLSGLSPRENREIPELRYDWVYRIKQEQPQWTIILNGGVTEPAEVASHLQYVDGVMLGRAAYQNPWILVECQRLLSQEAELPERADIVHLMQEYCRQQAALGVPVKHISRHMLGLFQGLPGARRWRRWISENAHLDDSDHLLIARAFKHYQPINPEKDAA